jgi:hypothetical protein
MPITLDDVQRMAQKLNNLTFPKDFLEGSWDARAELAAHPARSSFAGSIPDKPSTDMLRALHAPEVTGDSRQALAIEVEDLLGYTPLRKDARAPSKLQRLLAELEIAAFDPATVTAYKDRMLAHFGARAEQKSSHWGVISIIDVRWRTSSLHAYAKPVPEFVLRKCLQIKKREPAAAFFVDELVEVHRTLDPFLVVTLGGDLPLPGADFAHIEVWDEPEFEKTL